MTPPPRRTVTTTATKDTDPTEPIALPPRQQAVIELLQIPLIPLIGLATYQTMTFPEGQVSPYALDVHTVQRHAPAMAEAVDMLASNYPVLGAMLDRVATTTPFVALVGVVIAVGAQIAENHGKLPESLRGISPGVVDRQTYAQHVAAEAAAMAAARNGSEG